MIDRFSENANIGELVVIQEGVVLGKTFLSGIIRLFWEIPELGIT